MEKIGIVTLELVLGQLKAIQSFLEEQYDMTCNEGIGEKFEELICLLEQQKMEESE